MSAASSGSMLPRTFAALASSRSSMKSAWYSSSISEMASVAWLIVEVFEHVRALLRIELLQDVGNVGGVQLVEALVRDGQLHFREVAVEQVHVVPGDDAARRSACRKAFATETTARSSQGASPRRMPRTPTSAPSRRSCVPDCESFRSFTRTTLRPWVSTIWRSMQVACEQAPRRAASS